jgi:hypothetical protein
MNCRVPKIVAVSLLIAGANSAIAQEDGFRQPTPSSLTSLIQEAAKLRAPLYTEYNVGNYSRSFRLSSRFCCLVAARRTLLSLL